MRDALDNLSQWRLRRGCGWRLRPGSAELMRILCVSTSAADLGYVTPVFEALASEDWCDASLRKAPCQDWEADDALSIAAIFGKVMQWAVGALYGHDAVYIVGDRFDALAVATAATLRGVPIIHLAGGAVTLGSYDDSFRWAISQMATLHLAICEEDASWLRSSHVNGPIEFTGSPALDALVGKSRPPADPPYVLAMVRPETRGGADVLGAVTEGLSGLGAEVHWFTGMSDVGTEEHEEAKRLPRAEFIEMLSGAACVVGNSSCGILEAPFIGVPALDVGHRQFGRARSGNVRHCGLLPDEIRKFADGNTRGARCTRFPSDETYGDGNSTQECMGAIHGWWEAR